MNLSIAFAVGVMIGGCASTTGQNASTAASYEAQQLDCVNKATTREESQVCRCKVQEAFGRVCDLPIHDAGADK